MAEAAIEQLNKNKNYCKKSLMPTETIDKIYKYINISYGGWFTRIQIFRQQ